MTELEENELICERLLGWQRTQPPEGLQPEFIWLRPYRYGVPGSVVYSVTPDFANWQDVGLILDHIQDDTTILISSIPNLWRCAFGKLHSRTIFGLDGRRTGPLAIRAAALAIIRDSHTARSACPDPTTT